MDQPVEHFAEWNKPKINIAWYHLQLESLKKKQSNSKKQSSKVVARARDWGEAHRERLVKGYRLSFSSWIISEDLMYNIVIDNTVLQKLAKRVALKCSQPNKRGTYVKW